MHDFNSASEQRTGELIPDGTIAPVHLTVRPGNSGEGGWLKRSKAGDSEALDCEFTVTEGPHAKRKFWTLFTVQGTTEGQQKAADISFSRIRAILESANGVRPDDESDHAKSKRRLSSYGELDGVRFVAKIGVEKGKDGYKDKNILAEVITPDRKQWAKIEQPPRQQGFQQIGAAAQAATANAAQAAGKPAWAS
jgi:hypothetical protein